MIKDLDVGVSVPVLTSQQLVPVCCNFHTFWGLIYLSSYLLNPNLNLNPNPPTIREALIIRTPTDPVPIDTYNEALFTAMILVEEAI